MEISSSPDRTPPPPPPPPAPRPETNGHDRSSDKAGGAVDHRRPEEDDKQRTVPIPPVLPAFTAPDGRGRGRRDQPEVKEVKKVNGSPVKVDIDKSTEKTAASPNANNTGNAGNNGSSNKGNSSGSTTPPPNDSRPKEDAAPPQDTTPPANGRSIQSGPYPDRSKENEKDPKPTVGEVVGAVAAAVITGGFRDGGRIDIEVTAKTPEAAAPKASENRTNAAAAAGAAAAKAAAEGDMVARSAATANTAKPSDTASAEAAAGNTADQSPSANAGTTDVEPITPPSAPIPRADTPPKPAATAAGAQEVEPAAAGSAGDGTGKEVKPQRRPNPADDMFPYDQNTWDGGGAGSAGGSGEVDPAGGGSGSEAEPASHGNPPMPSGRSRGAAPSNTDASPTPPAANQTDANTAAARPAAAPTPAGNPTPSAANQIEVAGGQRTADSQADSPGAREGFVHNPKFGNKTAANEQADAPAPDPQWQSRQNARTGRSTSRARIYEGDVGWGEGKNWRSATDPNSGPTANADPKATNTNRGKATGTQAGQGQPPPYKKPIPKDERDMPRKDGVGKRVGAGVATLVGAIVASPAAVAESLRKGGASNPVDTGKKNIFRQRIYTTRVYTKNGRSVVRTIRAKNYNAAYARARKIERQRIRNGFKRFYSN